MTILRSPKNKIKAAIVGTGSLLLVATPTTALAHWSGHSGSSFQQGSHFNTQTASAHVSASSNMKSRSQSDKDKDHDDNHNNSSANRPNLTCDQRQQILSQQAATAQVKDKKQLTGLNIMLNGVETYATSGTVTVANYDTMNNQALADQTNATNAVNAVAAPDLNCADPSSANNSQSTFKTDKATLTQQINTANSTLRTYRQDLGKLFWAAINS